MLGGELEACIIRGHCSRCNARRPIAWISTMKMLRHCPEMRVPSLHVRLETGPYRAIQLLNRHISEARLAVDTYRQSRSRADSYRKLRGTTSFRTRTTSRQSKPLSAPLFSPRGNRLGLGNCLLEAVRVGSIKIVSRSSQ